MDQDFENLSDHKYIFFRIGDFEQSSKNHVGNSPRWSFDKLDVEIWLHMALEWACAVGMMEEEKSLAEGIQRWLKRVM